MCSPSTCTLLALINMAASSSEAFVPSTTSNVDSDDELENELFACMDTRKEIVQDEEIARALQQEEYCQERPALVGRRTSDFCLLSSLPDDLISRVFGFVSVATLLGSVRIASTRCSSLAISEVHRSTRAQLRDAMLAGFESDAAAAMHSSVAPSAGGPTPSHAAESPTGALEPDELLESLAASAALVRSASLAAPTALAASASPVGSASSALEAAPSAVSGAPLSAAEEQRLSALAAQLEDALCRVTPSPSAFSKRVRSLCFNLRDKKNPELRRKLLDGFISPQAMASMTAHEMASSVEKEKRAAWHARSLACAIKTDARVLGHLTDLYLCESCGSKSTRVHRCIRPGRAIDRARSYATCSECGTRWEV